jgi:hypothetical protein
MQNQLKNLTDKVAQMKEQIGTEEATKTAFVLPFLKLLGYDIFNPMEVQLSLSSVNIGKKIWMYIVHNCFVTFT